MDMLMFQDINSKHLQMYILTLIKKADVLNCNNSQCNSSKSN